MPKNLENATRFTREFNKVPGYKVIIHILIIILHTNKKEIKPTKILTNLNLTKYVLDPK